ncbi:MAG: hypothetical protein ACXABY_06055 [Candidatus Thorarchaeota archaeon]|jgi:hypothetical protein
MPRIKKGDRVFINKCDVTNDHYGMTDAMGAEVGMVREVGEIDEYDGAVILLPNNNAWHQDDLVLEGQAIKDGLIGKAAVPKKKRKEVEAPDWFKAFGPGVLSVGACSIYYLMYRPQKGEVTKRPTYKELNKRATDQSRKVRKLDPAYGCVNWTLRMGRVWWSVVVRIVYSLTPVGNLVIMPALQL